MDYKMQNIYSNLGSSIMSPTSDDYLLSKIKTNVIPYHKLSHITDINKLFINDSFIILYRGKNVPVGHWCCIVRRGNTLSYFDSFGREPDDPQCLGRGYPYLSVLLLNSNYDLEYNEYDYQSKKTSTCGHHCIVRILFKYLPLKDYQNFMSQFKNDDEVVTAISQML